MSASVTLRCGTELDADQICGATLQLAVESVDQAREQATDQHGWTYADDDRCDHHSRTTSRPRVTDGWPLDGP